MLVTVYLKNPPAEANYWQVLVTDWDFTQSISWAVPAHDNIAEPALLDIPTGWSLPLRVSIGAYYQWQENEEWHSRQLYYAQSFWPYLWDHDEDEWSTEPDPTYREIFIPEYGSYYYNVTTEQFETVTPALPDIITPLIGMVMMVAVMGLVMKEI